MTKEEFQQLFDIGNSQMDMGLFKKAYETFTRIIEKQSDCSMGYEYRALASIQLQNTQDAIEDTKKAIFFNQDNHNAYFNLSSIYFDMEDYQLSLIYIEKAIQISKRQNIYYLSCLCETLLKLKNYEISHDICFEILESEDINDDLFNYALDYLSEIYWYTKEYQKALDIELKIIEKTQKIDVKNYLNVGFFHALLENTKEARENLENGLLLLKNRNYQDAEERINHSYLLNNLGYVDYLENKFEIGIQKIKESLELNSANSYAYKNLGLIYLKLNKKDLAKSNFEMALDLGFEELYGDELNILMQKNDLF